MGIWIELGVFLLALAFGLWQIQDVKKAREATRRQRAQAQAHAEGKPSGPSDAQAAVRPGESASGKDGRTDGSRDGGGEDVTAGHQAGERTDSKASRLSERR